MKSSTGQHYVALDHVRALAAFIVFNWHFFHTWEGFPIPFEWAPRLPPFALLDEGHWGVALFMTLSGYLFAKLLDGRSILFWRFLWNRVIRLVPLLVLVMVINGVMRYFKGESLEAYFSLLIRGFVIWTWPNGGWSVAVELQFYLLLPLLLWLVRRSRWMPLVVVAAALVLRVLLWRIYGEVHTFSYFTIIGRIDQFVLGIVVFHYRRLLTGRHLLATALLVGFTLFYWQLDRLGGFFKYPVYPSPSPLWIVLPTIEAVTFASLIAWYDTSFRHMSGTFSRWLGKVGEYSYSMYLWHFFFVFEMSRFVNDHVMKLTNLYVTAAWALLGYLLMIPVCWLSYRFIELPFLRFRTQYVVR